MNKLKITAAIATIIASHLAANNCLSAAPQTATPGSTLEGIGGAAAKTVAVFKGLFSKPDNSSRNDLLELINTQPDGVYVFFDKTNSRLIYYNPQTGAVSSSKVQGQQPAGQPAAVSPPAAQQLLPAAVPPPAAQQLLPAGHVQPQPAVQQQLQNNQWQQPAVQQQQTQSTQPFQTTLQRQQIHISKSTKKGLQEVGSTDLFKRYRDLFTGDDIYKDQRTGVWVSVGSNQGVYVYHVYLNDNWFPVSDLNKLDQLLRQAVLNVISYYTPLPPDVRMAQKPLQPQVIYQMNTPQVISQTPPQASFQTRYR
jgi:hypothetical protein